jgi:hypothetical protein
LDDFVERGNPFFGGSVDIFGLGGSHDSRKVGHWESDQARLLYAISRIDTISIRYRYCIEKSI